VLCKIELQITSRACAPSRNCADNEELCVRPPSRVQALPFGGRDRLEASPSRGENYITSRGRSEPIGLFAAIGSVERVVTRSGRLAEGKVSGEQFR